MSAQTKRPREGSNGLTRNEMWMFRMMAEHREVVERVIEESTDDDPASRRKVIRAIQNQPEQSKLDQLARSLVRRALREHAGEEGAALDAVVDAINLALGREAVTRE